METESPTERLIQSASPGAGVTPGVRDACTGNVLECVTLGQRGGRVLMQLQVVAGGRGRARFRRAASGGNSDIPRDFMKVSVAATQDLQS